METEILKEIEEYYIRNNIERLDYEKMYVGKGFKDLFEEALYSNTSINSENYPFINKSLYMAVPVEYLINKSIGFQEGFNKMIESFYKELKRKNGICIIPEMIDENQEKIYRDKNGLYIYYSYKYDDDSREYYAKYTCFYKEIVL